MEKQHTIAMKSKSLLPLLSLLLLARCDKPSSSDSSAEFALGKPFVVELNTVCREDGGPLNILPMQVVEDSRCPTYAICVWEGQVLVDLLLKANGQELRDTLSTTRYLYGGDSVFFQGYKIKLLQVDPPRDRPVIPQEEYRLHLKVTK